MLRGGAMSTFGSRAALGSQSIQRNLDTREQDPAEVLAFGRDDLEVSRRPEVHHYGRATVAFESRHCICDPVCAHLLRVVDQHRHAGADTGLDEDRRNAPAVWSAIWRRATCSGGTTHETTAPVTAEKSRPSRASKSESCRANSSAVYTGWVATRQ